MGASLHRRGLIGTAGALMAAGASGGIGLGRPARAQTADRLVLIISSATLEPGTSTFTSLPEMLGLLQEEKLDLEIKSTAGSAISGQLVAAGQADVTHAGTSVGLMLPAAKGAQLKAYYNVIIHNFQMPAVPVDSPVKTLADLKGKKLGIIGMATATIPIVKSVLEKAGLNPEIDVTFVPVGYGAQAAAALWITRQVDGLAMYDSVYANIENVNPDKYKLRILSSPEADRVSFQTALVTRTDLLKTKRSALIKLGRIQAKTTIFALENPKAAIQLHWKKFPEQKPGGVGEEVAIAREQHALLARMENLRIDTMAVPRDKWGYIDAIDVTVYLDMLKKLGDVPANVAPETLYTNELIAEINDFDREKWRSYARAYTVRS